MSMAMINGNYGMHHSSLLHFMFGPTWQHCEQSRKHAICLNVEHRKLNQLYKSPNSS